jgi:hypothetical protein
MKKERRTYAFPIVLVVPLPTTMARSNPLTKLTSTTPKPDIGELRQLFTNGADRSRMGVTGLVDACGMLLIELGF